jgi:superoxide dismutase
MQPKKYQFGNLAPELSVKMFEDHWTLYEKYVAHLNEVLSKLSNPYDLELIQSASPAAGEWRDLANDKTRLTNAVILHELFFENVLLPPHSAPMPPGPTFQSMVQEHFPQVKASDFWSHIIKPTCKAARAFCIVGWDCIQAKMDISMMDDNAGPCLAGLYPLIVIDTSEHAYYEQYDADKGTYLDHLFRSLNWNIVEHRVATVHSASEIMRTAVPEEAEDYIRDKFDDQTDTEFGFPGEDYWEKGNTPQSKGLDSRNEMGIQPNPRAHSSVEGTVTEADIQVAYDRIKTLAAVTFSSEDDMFDKEVKGRNKAFRETLWERLRKDS